MTPSADGAWISRQRYSGISIVYSERQDRDETQRHNLCPGRPPRDQPRCAEVSPLKRNRHVGPAALLVEAQTWERRWGVREKRDRKILVALL